MDHKEAHHLRLYVLAALFFIVAAVYIGVLYDTQVNNYDYYYASSVRSIARPETVEAARGNITDRNGKVLVSSRSSYNLTFDASLLEKDEDANESLLRLLQLCQSRGINWVDSLPISRSAPFAYTIDSLDSAARSRFLTYLKDLDEAANALAAYLLEHPALLETTDEEGNRENPADHILADEELDQAGKAQALLEELTSSQLTGAMLEGSGLSATRLIALMRKDFGLSASFSVEEARLVLGVQYEIRSRNLARTDAYVLAEDIDAELISLLNDGDYAGAKITPSSVREYETTYGAHILGYLGKINDSAEKEALGEGYNWNDYVGKSSLVNEILFKKLGVELNRMKVHPGRCDRIEGIEYLDKVVDIDQSPIGRTPRSNPATYTGLFNDIRDLFASTQEAKSRGYGPGRFSFNVRGGRCEACSGDGVLKIEMHFLPDIFVPCEVCKGRRYNRETLEVRYKGKNIADVLEMTVDEAVEFFAPLPRIRNKLQTLCDVGLGYVKLGQPSTELSGGEAQRVKLATELSKIATGKTIYILDEPTTGLHTDDVRKLLEVLQRLVDSGNTVVVIEHNLDVIKCADHLIDLGPEGGDGGGTIVCTGTPEEVAACRSSFTGRYLKKLLER